MERIAPDTWACKATSYTKPPCCAASWKINGPRHVPLDDLRFSHITEDDPGEADSDSATVFQRDALTQLAREAGFDSGKKLIETGPSPDAKIAYCSFCGKSQNEVKKLIAGPKVYVCNECIGLCNDILEEEPADEPMEIPASGVEMPVSRLLRRLFIESLTAIACFYCPRHKRRSCGRIPRAGPR